MTRTARHGTAPIVAQDVWFWYANSDRPVLRGGKVQIEPGQVVALVGANGSGKTTLAKVLAGLYLPERGRVLLHGADTATAVRRVGYMLGALEATLAQGAPGTGMTTRRGSLRACIADGTPSRPSPESRTPP